MLLVFAETDGSFAPFSPMEDFMKRFPIPVLCAGLASAAVLAQTAPPPTPTPGDYAPTTRSSSAAGTELLTGTVWKYSAGQSITIRTGDGRDHELALQSGVRVDGAVVVGGPAALMWMTDNAGKTRVMSITAPPGSAMETQGSTTSPYRPSTTPVRTPNPARSTTPGPRSDQYPSPGPSPRPTPAGPSR